MATIIKFEAGVSEVLALKFDAGKNVAGKFGPQVQFSTTDDRLFYLDEAPAYDVETTLRALGIKAGTPFRLTKVKTSHGGSRFDVAPAPRGDEGGHNVPERGNVAGARSPESAPAAPATNQPLQSATPGITPNAARMMACFMDAITAITEAQVFAKRVGLGITFDSTNVTSAALSCYIAQTRNGGGC